MAKLKKEFAGQEPKPNPRQMIAYSHTFAKAIIDLMFARRTPFKSAICGCSFAIAKILCHMVANAEIDEAQAEMEIDRLPELIKKFCRADIRPILKETDKN